LVKSGSLGIQKPTAATIARFCVALDAYSSFPTSIHQFEGGTSIARCTRGQIARIKFQRALRIKTAQHRVKVFRSATFTQFI